MSGFHLKLKLVPAIFSLSERFNTKTKIVNLAKDFEIYLGAFVFCSQTTFCS